MGDSSTVGSGEEGREGRAGTAEGHNGVMSTAGETAEASFELGYDDPGNCNCDGSVGYGGPVPVGYGGPVW